MNDIIKKALDWALETAKDNTHGYSQAVRWGPDYDCSSFIISAYENAGLKVKEAGASYTGNMRDAFEKCGFGAYPRQPVSKLEPGDVLLNERHHAVMYIGDGKVVAARSSDGFPQSGDQSSREICIQDYYDWPDGGWDCVLRYGPVSLNKLEELFKDAPRKYGEYCYPEVPVLKKGTRGGPVKAMQLLLIKKGFSCGPCAADGDFGPDTLDALLMFQDIHMIGKIDGICNKETWEELIDI